MADMVICMKDIIPSFVCFTCNNFYYILIDDIHHILIHFDYIRTDDIQYHFGYDENQSGLPLIFHVKKIPMCT